MDVLTCSIILFLQGNLKDAFSLYEQTIAIEKGKEHSQVLPMLYAQYSRFLYLVSSVMPSVRPLSLTFLDLCRIKNYISDLCLVSSFFLSFCDAIHTS